MKRLSCGWHLLLSCTPLAGAVESECCAQSFPWGFSLVVLVSRRRPRSGRRSAILVVVDRLESLRWASEQRRPCDRFGGPGAWWVIRSGLPLLRWPPALLVAENERPGPG